ncbi:MAG: protein kinase [Candidatus Schekmanbacteria bacterium]|nr:protein kinase [Candidatus Schekmanbacteria bacterium]
MNVVSASIDDRFVIQRCLGRGGFGIVYAAHDRERDQLVALKALFRATPQALVDLKREFRMLAGIVHVNLVTLHELFASDPCWFFTMELVDGISFRDYVCYQAPRPAADDTEPSPTPAAMGFGATTLPSAAAAAVDQNRTSPACGDPTAESPAWRSAETLRQTLTAAARAATASIASSESEAAALPPPDTARLTAVSLQLVEAIEALHRRGVAHCDLKPANVLVTKAGRVVVLDFGVATALDAGGDRAAASRGGTPAYMAPEQLDSRGASPASDWYAFGTMLFEALAGCRPFLGDSHEVLAQKLARPAPSPAQLRPECGDHLAELCRRLLDRNPERRPGGAQIREALAGERPIRAPEALRHGSRTAFVGRDEQLRELNDALAVAIQGGTVAVTLQGAAGFGKTRLIEHWLSSIPPEIMAFRSRCFESERIPFKALDAIIDELSERLERDESLRGVTVEKVLQRLFPVLRPRAAGEAAGAGESESTAGATASCAESASRRPATSPPRDCGQRDEGAHCHAGGEQAVDSDEVRAWHGGGLEDRLAAARAWRGLVSQLLGCNAVLLVLDDLQWGDEDSTWLLEELLAPPLARRLMVLLAFRSAAVEQTPSLDRLLRALRSPGAAGVHAVSLSVERFTDAEASALVRSCGGPRAAQGDALTPIAREADGDPLLLAELIGEAASASPGPPHAFPVETSDSGLRQIVRRRTAQLDAHAARLLKIVSVFGRPMGRALASGALGAEVNSGLLTQLRARHLLRVSGSGGREQLEPFHDRMRHEVTNALSAEDRVALHRAIVHAIVAAELDDAENLAVHGDAAGLGAIALPAALRAAYRAREALAFERAAEFLGVAVRWTAAGDAAAQVQLREQQAACLIDAGCAAGAADVLLAAAAHAEGLAAVRLRASAGEQYLRAGRIRTGLSLLRPILADFGVSFPSSRWHAIRLTMRFFWRCYRWQGRTPQRPIAAATGEDLLRADIALTATVPLFLTDHLACIAVQSQGCWYSLATGEPSRVCRATAYLYSVVAAVPGVLAQRWAGRLHGDAQRLLAHQDPGKLQIMVGVGDIDRHLSAGEWSRAMRAAEDVMAMVERSGGAFSFEGFLAESLVAMLMMFRGRLLELSARSGPAAAKARARGDRWQQWIIEMLDIPTAQMMRDAPEEALRAVDQAWAAWSEDHPELPAMGLDRWYYLLSRVQVRLYQGRVAEAWGMLETNWPLIRRSLMLEVSPLDAALAHWVRGATAAAMGPAHRRARAAARAAVRTLRRRRGSLFKATADLIAARMSALAGDLEAARRLLRRADERACEEDLMLIAWIARWRWAEIAGGAAGEQTIAGVRAALAAQGVVAPESMIRAFCP